MIFSQLFRFDGRYSWGRGHYRQADEEEEKKILYF